MNEAEEQQVKNSATTSRTNVVQDDFQSSLEKTRLFISPYLPPPILLAMKEIDSNPNIKFIGNEPSMSILAALLAIVIIGQCIKFVSFLTTGKAVEGLDDDDAPEGNVLSDLGNEVKDDMSGSYDDTVIIFGPSQSGKTCLFHTINKKRENVYIPKTVMSLKANATMMKKNGNNNGPSTGKHHVRVIDYPGHITLSSQLPSLIYPNATLTGGNVRAILVVDSTKSVSDAAMLLYNTIFTNAKLLNAWETEGKELHIMVACSKTDATNAKNWRRVKIQLRSELEKFKKISSVVASDDTVNLNNEDKRQLSGKSIDLDNLSKNGLKQIRMSFLSISCISSEGLAEVTAFATNGDILMENTSVLKSRKI
jgi:signal recognition particle receptor subunit beta